MSEKAKEFCATIGLSSISELEDALSRDPSLVMPFKKGRRESSAYKEAKLFLQSAQEYKATEDNISFARQIYAIIRSASIRYAVDNYEGEGAKLALHMQEQGETFTDRLTSRQTPSQYAGLGSRFSRNVEMINRSSQIDIQTELSGLYAQQSVENTQFAGEVHQVVSGLTS